MDSEISILQVGDNLSYLYRYGRSNAFAVDPSRGSSVLHVLQERSLNLTMVLVTHHHWDHTAGVVELKRKTGCKVIGCDAQRIPGIDQVVDDGQMLAVGGSKIQVIVTPGHTRTGACYYMRPSKDNEKGILWTGDTLFVGGCGRMFECDARSMWDSLQRLASLPKQTLVYCGHDYTVENYEFALTIEPDNQALKERLERVKRTLRQGRHTVPSTILQERITNPFLRAGSFEIKTALNMADAEAVDVFSELRRRKDLF